MAKTRRYRWRGFGEQARNPERPVKVKKGPIPGAKGSRPMTAKQANYLRVLCEKTGAQFNADLSSRTASSEINRLKNVLAVQKKQDPEPEKLEAPEFV